MKNFDPASTALRFPEGFLWGVGTSAYQVEGSPGNSQWCKFEQSGGVQTGERSGTACEWWDNAERDFDIAQSMGLNSLRLSVSWARIEPEDGIFDPAAIERYRHMLMALQMRGIRPIVCLHHFAHPLWFDKKGAFLNRSCVADFTRFTRFTVAELGDLCNDWLTINEPNVYAVQGYLDGEFPPALVDSLFNYFKVLGNLGLCHAGAYRVIKDLLPDSSVSYANHFISFTHEKDQAFDRFASRLAQGSFNDVFLKMIGEGRAPLLAGLGLKAGQIRDTWDYVGINTYGGLDVAFDIRKYRQGFVRRVLPSNGRIGDIDPSGNPMFGEIYPQGIRMAVEKCARFGKPFFILENGVPDRDDKLRPWVIAVAVKTMHDLIREGHEILGYHHWTLVDNFEWAYGYAMKFGLVEMDPATRERRPRPSAAFYGEIARANALTPQMLLKYAPEALSDVFPELARADI
jgi:beta-glucosidase